MTKSIKEVLEQTIQISEIGYVPESVPKDGSKNWFTVNGRVFRFHIDQALKEIEAIIRTEELEAMIDTLEYAKISPKFKIEEKIEQLRLELKKYE